MLIQKKNIPKQFLLNQHNHSAMTGRIHYCRSFSHQLSKQPCFPSFTSFTYSCLSFFRSHFTKPSKNQKNFFTFPSVASTMILLVNWTLDFCKSIPLYTSTVVSTRNPAIFLKVSSLSVIVSKSRLSLFCSSAYSRPWNY